ncbi:hypothetical protein [Motilibacter peucedani]|uniref:hypothetical protein n=1 Tax=Motilibacter peucedani TaxID=598650 RepID=UPI000EAE7F2D|nr:hypothetical protein [Motilibacter peucedani]
MEQHVGRMTVHDRVLLALLVLVVLCLALPQLDFGWTAKVLPTTARLHPYPATSRVCTDPGTRPTAPRAPAAPVNVAAFTGGTGGATGPTFELRVGRDGRMVVERLLGMEIRGGGRLPATARLRAIVGPLHHDGDRLQFPPELVSAWYTGTPSGSSVNFSFCASPQNVTTRLPAGRYTGTVRIEDPRATGGTVPVTVLVVYPRLALVAAAGLLAAGAGVTWAWLVRLGGGTTQERQHPWVLVVVRLAAMLVSFGVMDRLVLQDAGWDGSWTAYGTLMGAVFTAVVAAVPTLRAIGTRVTK